MERIILEVQTSAAVKVAQFDRNECSCNSKVAINGEKSLEIVYPVPADGEDKSEYFTTVGNIIKVLNQNTNAYNLYVISKYSKARNDNGSITVKTLAEGKALLHFNQRVVSSLYNCRNVTPTAILTEILTYTTGYSVGTVGPTTKVSLYNLGHETVASAIQKICEVCHAEYEVIDSTGAVNISTSLGANNNVKITVGRNLKSLQNTKYTRKIVNKMYGIGGGMPPATIAGARHEVKSILGAVITCVGNCVVAENDAWNTYKIKFKTGAEAGNLFTISDCASGATDDTITCSAAPGAAAGDLFVITTSAGVEVKFLLAATSVASYGTIEGIYKDSRYLNTTNFVLKPFLDGTYAAGLCDKWTKEGTPTVSEETAATYIQYGSASQKVIGDADAEGVSQAVTVPNAGYYNVSAWVYISAGTVILSAADGTNTYTISKTGTGWQKFTITEYFASTTITVKILQSGAPAATFYVDAVQICSGVMERSFTASNDAKQLWDLVCQKIKTIKDPQIEYQIDFVDLNKLDPINYPYEAIALGDTLTITDSDLGIDGLTARIKEIYTDEFNPENTRYTISNL